MKEFKVLNKETLQEGYAFLAEKEPQFKKILKEKNYQINPFNKKEGFEGLISLIVEQQLSVASANAIFGRVKALVKPFKPKVFLQTDIEKFKEAGLSKQKIDYCCGIAALIENKELDLNGLAKKEDAESESHFVRISGDHIVRACRSRTKPMSRHLVFPLHGIATRPSLTSTYRLS